METTFGKNLKKEAVTSGLIWGAINVVLFLVVYYIAPQLMSSAWYGLFSILIGILLAIYFCKDLRKKAGGFWTFSKALPHIFIMFIVSATLVYAFTMLFGKVIEPEYSVKMKEMVLESSENTMRDFGLSDDQIEQAREKTIESLDKQFDPTVSQAFVGYGIVAIMYFVGALIFAAIFKKNPPLFVHEEDDDDQPVTTV